MAAVAARLAARRTLDLLRFGSGTAERLGAAIVVVAPFAFIFLAITVAVGMPVLTGALIAGAALLVALATSAVFVLRTPDAELEGRINAMREDASILRLRLNDLLEKEEREQYDDEMEEWRSRLLHALCPFCRKKIFYDALKCPEYHKYLDERLPCVTHPGVPGRDQPRYEWSAPCTVFVSRTAENAEYQRW